MSDTVPVPRRAVEAYVNSSDGERWPKLRDEFAAALAANPKPPRRLRVVSLDPPMDWMTHNGGYVNVPKTVSDLANLPDPMSAVEQAVDEWVRSPNESNSYGTVVDHNDQRALVARIRTALEGASR